MSRGAIQGLHASRRQASLDKRAAVLRALDAAMDSSEKITISGVAREARVSREFIHTQGDLAERIRQSGRQQAELRRRLESDEANWREGQAVDRATLMKKLVEQRKRIGSLEQKVDELRAARRRLLGERLVALDSPSSIETLEALVTSEHFASENERLQRELDEAVKLPTRLRGELGGARELLRELLRDSAGEEALRPIVPIRSADPRPGDSV